MQLSGKLICLCCNVRVDVFLRHTLLVPNAPERAEGAKKIQYFDHFLGRFGFFGDTFWGVHFLGGTLFPPRPARGEKKSVR